MSRKRMAGRLEGTHAFLHDRLPEARTRGRFLDEIDIATEERDQAFAQRLQAGKMIEASQGESHPWTHRQIHVRRAGCIAPGKRPEQGYRLDATRSQLGLVRTKNRQQ